MNENEIQRAVFDHFRARGAPGAFAFHPKNGGIHQRGRRRGINKGLGVIPGVPDVIVIHCGRCYALELKTDVGKLSETQVQVLEQLEHAGAICHVANGLDPAIAWLEERKLLMGRAA